MPLTKVRAGGYDTGGIIQVKNTVFSGTNTVAYASNTDTKLTDLSVNITPTSTSSIIRLEAFVTGELSNNSTHYNIVWFFFRDNTKLGATGGGNRPQGIQMGVARSYYAANASSTPETAAYMYFDSPSSTSQITYSVGLVSYYAGNWHLNRTVTDSNDVDHERGISSICATEIAG